MFTACSVKPQTIQKAHLRILPFLFALYVVAFVDRINIGFAALTMNRELAITSQQFGLLAGISLLGIFCSRSQATCSYTRLERAYGSHGFLVSCGVVFSASLFLLSTFMTESRTEEGQPVRRKTLLCQASKE
jgi:ACS family tartrate transporter-like MFS transporter